MADWLTDWLIDADIWTHISKIDWLWWWYNYSTVRCTITRIFRWLTDWLIDWLMMVYERIFQWLIDYDDDIIIVQSDVWMHIFQWLTDWLIDDDIWTHISMVDWLWWYNYSTVRCMNVYIPMTDWLIDWLMMIYERVF